MPSEFLEKDSQSYKQKSDRKQKPPHQCIADEEAFAQYIVNLECKRQSIGIIQEKSAKGLDSMRSDTTETVCEHSKQTLQEPHLEIRCPYCHQLSGHKYKTIFDVPSKIVCSQCNTPIEFPLSLATVVNGNG